MKKKTRVIVAVLAIVLAIGGGIWAYSHGYYHALRGGIAQNSRELDGAIEYFKIAHQKNPDAFMVAHDMACCYALKGEKESCIHWLRLALKSSYGGYAKEHAKSEHDFDSVRQSPEFQVLIYDSTK